MFQLHFEPGAYGALRNHLLPPDAREEQAAFALFDYGEARATKVLEVRDVLPLDEREFVSQRADYIEVSNDTRLRLIKAAHDKALGVAEFHSHPFDLPAEFSYADYLGLQQTVPHMLWRLRHRPYVAVVVGPRDFDGLVWQPDGSVDSLSHILEGADSFCATGRSLAQWQ